MDAQKILDILGNFKKGPQTTLFGFVCFLLGSFLITYKVINGVDLELVTVETAIFALGGYFVLSSDDILKLKK